MYPRSDSQKGVGYLAAAVLMLISSLSYAANLPASPTAEQEILEQKEEAEATVQTQRIIIPPDVEQALEQLPADTTPRYEIHEIRLSGNTLFTDEALLGEIPPVYNASLTEAIESEMLYDLRPLQTIYAEPGTSREVSARTIQGLTLYILSVYQEHNYAGIYVYVPATAFEAGAELDQGILPIRILEALVTEVSSSYFDVNNQPAEETYLSIKALEGWSPVKAGKVANQKKLDDYLNLLNLNPDRYVSAVVSQGPEENTLAVNYNVYEANPWHYFVQVDNSGTENIQWAPRFGVINTNLFGYDDELIAIYQVVPDSTWDDEYSIYGSYDFPVLGPKLRLNLFAAYNEFAITDTGGPVSFLGRGDFYGGRFRYNFYQKNDWFFDALVGTSYQRSRYTTDFDIFGPLFTTDIRMWTWDWGFEVSKLEDMSDTVFTFTQERTIDTSDEAAMAASRPGVDTHFVKDTFTARHSRYLENSKIQRLSGTFRWINPHDRLPSAKMTSFGGMYTVRGYDEYEITTDGGILASVQYEYDLVRKQQVELYGAPVEDNTNEDLRAPFLKKLAPLAFVDYGLARVEDPTATEDRDQELCSIGGGLITELGDNFTGTIYYGYPLIDTDDTRTGKGRLNVGLLFRW